MKIRANAMSHQSILCEKLVQDYVPDPVWQLGGHDHAFDLTVANGATRRGNTPVLCLYYALASLERPGGTEHK